MKKIAPKVFAYFLLTIFFSGIILSTGAVSPEIASAEDTYDVAIIDFNVVSEDESLEEMGDVLAEMMLTELVQIPGITVVERSRLESALEEQEMYEVGLMDEEDASEVGKIVGADYIVAGLIFDSDVTEQRFRMDYRLIEVERGIVELADTIEGDDEEALFDTMLEEAAISIGEGLFPEEMPDYEEEIKEAEESITIFEVIDERQLSIPDATIYIEELDKEIVTNERGIAEIDYIEDKIDEINFEVSHEDHQNYEGTIQAGKPSVPVELEDEEPPVTEVRIGGQEEVTEPGTVTFGMTLDENESGITVYVEITDEETGRTVEEWADITDEYGSISYELDFSEGMDTTYIMKASIDGDEGRVKEDRSDTHRVEINTVEEEEKYSVDIEVRDEQGRPIEGARVEFAGDVTETDRRGRATIEGVERGFSSYRIRKEDYETAEGRMLVREGIASQEITLEEIEEVDRGRIYGGGLYTTFSDDRLEYVEFGGYDLSSGFGGRAGLEISLIGGLSIMGEYSYLRAGDTMSEDNVYLDESVTLQSIRGTGALDVLEFAGYESVNLKFKGGAGLYFGTHEADWEMIENGEIIDTQATIGFDRTPGFTFGGELGIMLGSIAELFGSAEYRLLEISSGTIEIYEDGSREEDFSGEFQDFGLDPYDLSGLEIKAGLSLSF